MALIASHQWLTVFRAVSSVQPSGRGQAAMQTLSSAAFGAGSPRTGASPARPCQTCSETKGMIGWSNRHNPSRSAARTR